MYGQNPVFIPGPTNMPEILRKAADMPTMDHRSSMFGEILHPALAGVKQVLKTETASVFIFPATGSGGWETAITNTLSPGDRVLAGRHGMFSHKWIDMCRRYQLKVDAIESSWHDGVPLAQYEELLNGDKAHEIKAVLDTHNETATGVKSDVAAVRRLLNAANHPALLLVDGVSSIASMDFQWTNGASMYAVTGSQRDSC